MLFSAQYPGNACLGVNRRGIKNRQIGIILRDQHGDFRASQNDAVGSFYFHLFDDVTIIGPAFVAYDTTAKFFIDNAMNAAPRFLIGNHGRDTEQIAQPLRVERAFHGETGRKKRGVFTPGALQRFTGCVRDMQCRDSGRQFDGLMKTVHGVATDQQRLSA